GHDAMRDLVDVLARVVELQVGNRPRRAADRFAVHSADEAEKRLRGRKIAQDIFPLVVEGGAADLDQADVIGPGVPAQLPQSDRIELGRGRRRGVGGCTCMESLYGWMVSQFHRAPSRA